MITQPYLSPQDVEEGVHRGGPALLVNGKTFALWWNEGARTIMKLQREHQRFLFEVRPEIFEPCPVGVGVWSFVDLNQLREDEIAELTLEAWSTVVPKRRWREVGQLRGQAIGSSHGLR